MPRAARREDRLVVCMYAAYLAVMAWFFVGGLGDPRTWLAPVWPPGCVAGAVACLAYAAKPRNTMLLALSGCLTVCSFLGRAMVLVVGEANGYLAITDARAWFGAVGWTFNAVLAGYLWVAVLKPAAGDRRSRPRG